MTSESAGILEDIQDYVHRVARTLGVDPPEEMFEFGQRSKPGDRWYLIGLIGGKEVGKSALVNALVGRPISESTSHGPGTEKVVAYVHEDQADSVASFLQAEIPDRYEMVRHLQEDLNRRVLLDLPDIDSHYAVHFETVRKLIRFILFPVWIQSLEKYADRQPMELLRKVVQGNAPENFLYCLNKADQLERSGGEEAMKEIKEDYSSRIAQSLSLSQPPQVCLISALQPDKYDFPRVKAILNRQREEKDVQTSRTLALRQYGGSLLGWAKNQDLRDRVQRAERMEEQLINLLRHRIERPISEVMLPSVRQDARVENYLFGETFRARIQRWPIVRLVDTIAAPAMRMLRLTPAGGAVGVHRLGSEVVEDAFGQINPPLFQSLQACFAHCRGSYPQFAEVFSERPLWEERESKIAAGELRRDLIQEHESLTQKALDRLKGGGNPLGAIYRNLLVFGSLIWFPFGQPVLQKYLEEGDLGDIPLLVVRLLGVSSLLTSAIFLFLIFLFVWLSVRWRAQRSVQSALNLYWEEGNQSETGLEKVAREWGKSLVRPLEEEKVRMRELEKDREALESELAKIA
ncbi:MAG: hypothetical protein KC944_09385 [Candidatus Omnitrophica bacterium]|nr:hypothetical protein [Candidatus Omnitrophota bacterium]